MKKLLSFVLMAVIVIASLANPAFAAEEYPEVTVGTQVEAETAQGEDKIFVFTVPADGLYCFASSCTDDTDPFMKLGTEPDSDDIAYNDDSSGDYNFKKTLSLTAGDVIYLTVGSNDGGVVPFIITTLDECPHEDCLFYNEEPANSANTGTKAHWYCPDCELYFAEEDEEFLTPISYDDLIIPKIECDHSDMVFVEEVPATFEESGIIAHWECQICGDSFEDEAAEFWVSEDDLRIPVLECAHEHLTFVEEVPATDTEEGCKEHWYCPDCEKYFEDEDAEWEIDPEDLVISIACLHEGIYFVEEIPATEEEEGVKAHWYCPDCDKYFYDEDAEFELYEDELVIEKLCRHENMEYLEAVEPTYKSAGRNAHWHCLDCGMRFEDENGDYQIVWRYDVLIPPLNVADCPHEEVVFVEAVEPTEEESGHIAYWECTECHYYFADEAKEHMYEDEDVITNIDDCKHENLVYVDEVPATKEEDGHIGYWECQDCEEMFSSEEAVPKNKLYLNDIVIDSLCDHEHMVFHEYTAPTCTEWGNNPYWECEDCERYYYDQEGTKKITDKMIDGLEPIPHKFGPWVTTIQPTLTEKGIQTRYCEYDESHTDTRTIPMLKDIKLATVSSVKSSYSYTGKAIKPKAKVKMDGKTLKAGTDYTISYSANKKVGKATITIKGIGLYGGTLKKTFKIVKAKQPMTVKAKNATVKYSKVKSKKQTLKISKVATIKNAKGKVTYKKVSGNKKITINKKTGLITVAKGTKKGKYTVKIKVSAKGTSSYKSGSKTITVKITVK